MFVRGAVSRKARGDRSYRPVRPGFAVIDPDERRQAGQTLYGGNHTPADADQGGSDRDQSAADRDQLASDRDQAAADHDQEASDRDLAGGGDPAVHDSSREVRRQSARERRLGIQARLESAGTREAAAQARDLAAAERDRAAARLDREIDERDAIWAAERMLDTPSKSVRRMSAERERAAQDRRLAAEARSRAANDREEAAKDRAAAAADRLAANAHCDTLLRELAISETDGLTGARTRGPGLEDLEHEVDRARRSTGVLAVAYVDVVGLKAVNDSSGHMAGDCVLKAVVEAMRAHLRSYDTVVRIGGDEFLCMMAGASIETARQRLDAVQAALASGPGRCRIKVGIAGLRPGESAPELVARADAALPAVSAREM
jgi:diguanylate cyclase (GGDEF)-like protein